MNARHRIATAALLAGGVALAVGAIVLAGQLCPASTPTDPCPDADRNRVIVIGLVGTALALVVAALAFVTEYRLRRRIIYAGAWWRALRRGAWCGLALAALAALRLADALTPFSAAVVVGVAVAGEWLAIRRLDES